MEAALRMVYSKVNAEDVRRAEAKRAIFLITDGKANYGDPVNMATDLRETRRE